MQKIWKIPLREPIAASLSGSDDGGAGRASATVVDACPYRLLCSRRPRTIQRLAVTSAKLPQRNPYCPPMGLAEPAGPAIRPALPMVSVLLMPRALPMLTFWAALASLRHVRRSAPVTSLHLAIAA